MPPLLTSGVFKMERGLPPNRLVPAFRSTVDTYREVLPVVQVRHMRWLP